MNLYNEFYKHLGERYRENWTWDAEAKVKAQMIENVISELKGFTDNVDIEFEQWFNFAVKLGEEVNIIPSVLRLAKNWSRFRPNVGNDDPLSYYNSSLAVPFLTI